MNLKHLITAAFSVMLIAGTGLLGFDQIKAESLAPHANRQPESTSQNNQTPLSISRGALLVLLAVGVMGVLMVRRKKNAPNRAAQHQMSQKPPEDRDQVFIDLNKQYLNLQYKMMQHQFSGDPPPDGLLEEISDMKRKIRLISRALK